MKERNGKKYFKNQVTHKKVGIWELYVKSKGLVFKLFETLNTKEKNAYLDTCNEKGIFEGILLN